MARPAFIIRYEGTRMARYCDGNSNYMTIASHPALTLGDDVDGSGAFSLTSFMRIVQQNDNYARRIFAWGSNVDYPMLEVITFGKTSSYSGLLQTRLVSDQSITYRPTDYTSWDNGNWHHFALVGDGTTLIMYHDGIASEQTASMATLDAINQDNYFYVGRIVSGLATAYYCGHLAEIAKWDRALSGAEIAAIAAGASPERYPLLAVYLPLRGDLRERKANLSVTNYGTVLSEHPRVELPPQTGIIQPIIQRALGV